MPFTNITCLGNALSVFLWFIILSKGGEKWTCEDRIGPECAILILFYLSCDLVFPCR